MVVGPVATKDGQIQVTTTTAGVVTAAKDSVQVIRSDSEEAAYDAAMERLQHPHLGDFWSGTLDTGLSVTRGNSATLSYTLAGRAVRQTDRDKITVYTSAVYGKNDTTTPSQVIAHQITGGVRADINFSERWFVFAATDFNSNALQNLNLQNVIDGGIGGHLIKTKNAQFDVFAGAGYNQEFFGAYTLPNPTPPPATISSRPSRNGMRKPMWERRSARSSAAARPLTKHSIIFRISAGPAATGTRSILFFQPRSANGWAGNSV